MRDVIIIAEAGVNHNGSLETAKKMVDAAKECGADIIKFQTAKAEELVSKSAKMAEYQIQNIGNEETQLEMLQKVMLSYDDFRVLKDYCNSRKMTFLSTPFDIGSIDFLLELGIPFWKVPSGEITNYPYLKHIAMTHMDIVMSTGMSTLAEIKEAIEVLQKFDAGKISLLQCNTNYPTQMQDVNLLVMDRLQNEFGMPVGYSDHTEGIVASIGAVAMGACIIEKHFTLDRNMVGPDHKASLEPKELKAMVQAIRDLEIALGTAEKEPMDSERNNISVARKSIVAKLDIKAGECFTEENLTTKRPGTGISPMRWNEIIGLRAARNFKADELIEL